MTAVESMNAILRSVEQATGKPVVIEVDPSLPLHATLTIAREDMPVHIVRYRAAFEPERAYLVSYQCGFILRHTQAGPNHQFDLIATQAGRAEVESAIRYQLSRNKQSLPDKVLRGLRDRMYDGLGLQLRSIGPGLRVDNWIAIQYPALAEQQRVAVVRQLNENARSLGPEVKEITPYKILAPSLAMNAAFSLFFSRLWNDPLVTEPYRSSGQMTKGEELIRKFDAIPTEPENDMRLIEAWSQVLEIGLWYSLTPKSA